MCCSKCIIIIKQRCFLLLPLLRAQKCPANGGAHLCGLDSESSFRGASSWAHNLRNGRTSFCGQTGEAHLGGAELTCIAAPKPS